jgi:nitric oxide reductase subunit B
MQKSVRILLIASLVFLLGTLLFGLLATWAFLYPETFNRFLPFYQLRPFHVSAALFWMITAAVSSLLFFLREEQIIRRSNKKIVNFFTVGWLSTITVIFGCYTFKTFGGREYWEFPPLLCLPLLVCWLLLITYTFPEILKKISSQPIYVWMWFTGILFFGITFMEQNLWQITWFRQNYLKEITVQWKANGSIVGAWNQMIYGTSLYLMVKISGNAGIARGRAPFMFYLLGLINLMFNWGHHIYNVPAASWIRDTAYAISMTEWIFLLRMIAGFKRTLEQRKKLKHLLSYKFIIASEFWVLLNLLLTLSMSVPAVNRYTHGTHITVAHAMGATIGINTMILLGSFAYILEIQEESEFVNKFITLNYWISQVSLSVFWLSLIVAGVIKAYLTVEKGCNDFRDVMLQVVPAIEWFSFSGIFLALSLGSIAVLFISKSFYCRTDKTD